MNYKEAPETTPYGKPIITNLKGGGVFEILGTEGNGFMFERKAAERLLSPAAISRAAEHDGYLCFAEKTTGNIVIFELGGGQHFTSTTKKEMSAAKRAVTEQYPDYLKERGIKPMEAAKTRKRKNQPER